MFSTFGHSLGHSINENSPSSSFAQAGIGGLRLCPEAVLRDQVQDIDQRLAEPDRQRGIGIDHLLPGQNAAKQRGVVLGDQRAVSAALG